jgi:hypothetical protein
MSESTVRSQPVARTTAAGTTEVRSVASRAAFVVSGVLAVEAAVTSALVFFAWGVLENDAPMSVGNMRGTALAVLVIAVPLLVLAMALAARGSRRALYLWAGALAYLAYNAVLFCFGSHFSSFFLLLTTMLALSFWALIALLTSLDPERLRAASSGVPVRLVAGYLLVLAIAFAMLWLRDIVPGIVHNVAPASYEGTGLIVSPIHVLDFAFTFPVTVVGAVWLLRRRAWGYVLTGLMIVMMTVETAGIALDQLFGHRHDPGQPLAAVPIMIVLTVVGLAFCVLFLRGVRRGAA